jgi:short-subunit dehydrogenase
VATALVTGATAGIGKAFASRLAAAGHGLVLVARDVERLEGLAASLRDAHGIPVEVLPADLSDRDAVERVAQRLRDDAHPVDLLVNNAGFGVRGRFVGGDLALQERVLEVMVRAVLVLSHAAVPGMVERGRGAVINVGSVAGFVPGGPYSAAKAWVASFTVSLGIELHGTGVTATALCPGFVRTEFHQRAGASGGGPGWAWLDADRLVRDCLQDVRRGRLVSVPSRRYRVAVVLLRHLPPAALELIGRQRLGSHASVKPH